MSHNTLDQTFPFEITIHEPLSGDLNGRHKPHYKQMIDHILSATVPMQGIEEVDPKDYHTHFQQYFPIVSWSAYKPLPFNLSFYLVCHSRISVFKFFFMKW